MRTQMWTVGLIAVFALFAVLAMYLQMLSATPAGKMVQITDKIKEQYSLDDALVRVIRRNSEKIMAIEYTTSVYSGFDRDKQDEEMRKIATSALVRLQPADQRTVRTVTVTRSEIRSGGCFHREYSSSMEMPNPFRPDIMTD